MESIIRDVTALDDAHRRALEDVLGLQLQANQRLIINVLELEFPTVAQPDRPSQSLADWTKVYEGLGDHEIAQIDRVATTRAKLTRHLP